MFAVWRQDARQLQTPSIAWLPIGFLGLIEVQMLWLRTNVPELEIITILYGVAMFLAINSGFWVARLGWCNPFMYWTAASLILGGIFSVIVQIVQVFHLEATAPWLFAQYTTKMARRVFGNMYQPNHLATYLSLATAGAFYLWYQRRLSGWCWLLLSVILNIGIVLTASRMPWLQLTLLTLAGIWMVVYLERVEGNSMHHSLLRWWVPVAILPLMVIVTEVIQWANVALQLQLEGSAFDRLQQAGQVSGRLNLWRYGWKIFQHHWLLGAGWVNYADAQFALAGKLGPVEMADNAHNVVFDVFAKGGVIGAILVFLPLLLWVVRAVKRLKTSAPTAFAFIILGILFIHALLEYPQNYAFFLMPSMFLLGLTDTRALPWMKPLAVGFLNMLIFVAGIGFLVYLYRDYRRVEVAYCAGQIERYRRNPSYFFSPYGDYALAHALVLNRDALNAKLDAHRRAMSIGAGPSMIKRYTILLALAGRDDDALQAVQRLKQYNIKRFEREYASLLFMCEEQGHALGGFVSKLIQTFGNVMDNR
ncbi:PglL family O-oligosaccharyltransferase [Candidatus Pandoraea novymonadis]|uniref:Polymerase n=1 Tax=Candidatus Pandoraea novymonadis TaxID=1808959 RepID=A0ABX5FFV0_9BURK|nr:O-antigen ligase family protein [Candidatus Pandoraea novymonadis]PSB92353.1 hypothetical protein BZL35_00593 [Candidatus Pandoraea novymonadis]